MGARPGGWWDSARIGIGPPPMETPEGWLLIYHGVRQTVAGALYRAGLALLDLDEPTRVRRRCAEWVLGPREDVRAGRRRARGRLPLRAGPRRRTPTSSGSTTARPTAYIAVATASKAEVLDFLLDPRRGAGGLSSGRARPSPSAG